MNTIEANKANTAPKTFTPIVTVGRELPAKPAPRWAVPFTVVVIVVGLAVWLFYPGDLMDKLRWLNSGVCPQRPGHSYFFDGQQMPLEARMVGIFAGFGLTVFGFWLVGRGRALEWPRRWLSFGLLGLVGLMAFDGFNSTFLDLGWPTLYQPQNWIRLLTGSLSGVGMAGLILPAVSQVVWHRAYLTPTFKNWRELGLALIPALLYFAGVLSGWEWLYWPLSVAAVLGVIAMLTSFNLMIAAVIFRRENRAGSLADFLVLATPVLVFSLAEMMVFAVFRVALLGDTSAF